MKIHHSFKNSSIFSRSRRRWVHGHRIRLRGADWQAENMAVPFAICEKSLLRIPKDDLRRLMSSWKQYFRFVQESRGYASTDYHKSDIEHSARIQHAYSSSSRLYSSRDRDLGESCDLRCHWVTMILKDRHLTKFSKFSRSQPHKEWMCSLLSSYIISLCYPEYNFILSSFFFLLSFLSFFLFLFFYDSAAGALYRQRVWKHKCVEYEQKCSIDIFGRFDRIFIRCMWIARETFVLL